MCDHVLNSHDHSVYKALILQREIWCWSLLGRKGLNLSPANLRSRRNCFCARESFWRQSREAARGGSSPFSARLHSSSAKTLLAQTILPAPQAIHHVTGPWIVAERRGLPSPVCSLNAVREVCARCPLVMTDELLQDLAQYKTSKDKSKCVLNYSQFPEINQEYFHNNR